MTLSAREWNPGRIRDTFGSPAFGDIRFAMQWPSTAQPQPIVLALHYGFDPNAPFPAYYGEGLLEGLVEPALGSLGAVLVAPDSHGRQWTDPELQRGLFEFLDALADHPLVDGTRIGIVGYSMGGIGVWALASSSPDRFRAAIAMSARCDVTDASTLKSLPIRVIHSANDELFPLEDVRRVVSALVDEGAQIQVNEVTHPTHFDVGGFVSPLAEQRAWLVEHL
ncbi:MAG: alpha/beta fold hydrolase [Pseudomonadota bacterium]